MKEILLIIACTSATIVFGQSKKFQFKTGTEYGLPKKAEDLSFFGNDQDGIINLSLKKEALYISRFNPKNLAQTGEKVIELSDATKNMNSEMVVDFNNNYFWLRSDWDKNAQKEILYATSIDVKNGRLSDLNQKIIEAPKLAGDPVMTGLYKYKKVNKFDFHFNADHTKLLVSYRIAPESKKDKNSFDKIGIHVFDETLHKIWGSEFTMPYTEARMDNADFSIDSEGNAYLLAKVYDSDARKETDKATGDPAYHLEVFKFTKDNEQVIHAVVSVDTYFIRESTLIENTLHDMIIACTYSKNAKNKGTEGIFLGILNTEGKVDGYLKGHYKFPVSELEKFESARKRRKMEKNDDYEIPNLRVRDVAVEKDGSVFLACEEYYILQKSRMDGNGRFTYYTTYHYDDILATKIDASGNFQWIKKIPKRQEGSRGRGTMGFKLISDATGYYFLYLDNLKNLRLAEDDTPAKHVDGLGGQVFVSKVDHNGNISKELVFNTREEDIMIFPSEFTKINGKQFIGRAKLKKTLFKPLLITVN